MSLMSQAASHKPVLATFCGVVRGKVASYLSRVKVRRVTTPETETNQRQKGFLYAVACYLLWGGFPLYFTLVARSNPFEIVAARVLFSFIFCLLLLAVARQYKRFFAVLKNPRSLMVLLGASILIAANWLFYVIAVTTGHTLDASLGYFINPLVNVALGVIFLSERLRKLQWVAVAIATFAVLTLSILYGQVPWLGLGLAFSFGFYGLVKTKIGGRITPLLSLSAETILLTPLALIFMIWFLSTGESTLLSEGTGYTLLLASSGILTAVPLLLFGAAASRLPLSVVGMVQYMTPIMQFLLAYFAFGEELTPERWIGFILIWVALIVFTYDTLRHTRAQRKIRKA